MEKEKKLTYSEYPIDITQLKENFEKGITKYKYKKLCEVIGQPCTPDGSTRIYQRKYFEYFFKYHREGHSYIIEEIYKTPKEELYTNKRSQYYDNCIYPILLFAFENSTDGNPAIIYKTTLAKMLGFINMDFWKYRFNEEKIFKTFDIEDEVLDGFYARISTSYKSILKNTLEKMQRQGLIEYSEKLCGITKTDGFHILNDSEIEKINHITMLTFDKINKEHPIYKYYLPEAEDGWGMPNPLKAKKRKYEITSLNDIFKYGLEDEL